jgi:hypothetical protein
MKTLEQKKQEMIIKLKSAVDDKEIYAILSSLIYIYGGLRKGKKILQQGGIKYIPFYNTADANKR